MTSAEDLCSASLNDTKVKVMKGKHRKSHRGIKVSTMGSAGTGSILRRLRSTKVSSKARDRAEGSPHDDRGGKHVVFTPMNDEINRVLSNVRSVDVTDLSNDGSFIKSHLDNNPGLDRQSSPVAKSCGLQTSFDHTGMGDVGNNMCGPTSSKGGIASVKTGNVNDRDMAGSGTSNEHTSMEDVVNTGGVCSSSQDGIANYKDGSGFEFGRNVNSNGILNNPIGPLFSVQFGKNTPSNPFTKKSVVPNGGAWNKSRNNAFGSCMSSVNKLENGNRRICFSAEEVYKGGQACSLQLYGYFVGTSMNYRVDMGNLMRMWRVYDIKDITKTNFGIFYFKFKSEECMKKVLESGPWMVQNVPLVLDIWEPGIWLDKTEPSSIPIWVYVYNIPMKLCNGSGIGKIMSGVGKPLLMDKMTRERCLKKSCKMDFARVLVEVSAEDDLPNIIEIEYLPLGNRHARVGKLEVKYQWRPPLCMHCKTFGHTTLSCKVRPKPKEEIAAKTIKNAFKLNSFVSNDKNVEVDDGFVTMGRKNKPMESYSRPSSGDGVGIHVKNANNILGDKFSQSTSVKKPSIISSSKSLYQTSKQSNFQPKVLVRGSNSNSNLVSDETIPVKSSFSILCNDDGNVEDMGGINVDEEF
ncbi:hypothetical protein Tco_0749137 [Tanacetum coccineum]|uniref:DUF4283 domain-containing protein n=1 Tax=Tanacetum coccineum TaxID=301880 RepID=A0ABQ4YYK5_9ASTR